MTEGKETTKYKINKVKLLKDLERLEKKVQNGKKNQTDTMEYKKQIDYVSKELSDINIRIKAIFEKTKNLNEKFLEWKHSNSINIQSTSKYYTANKYNFKKAKIEY